MVSKTKCKLIFALGLLATLLGCQSSGKKSMHDTQMPLNPPVDYHVPNFVLFPSEGDSFQPRFSSDGLRVAFVSRLRQRHSSAQIYELDLVSRREKRLTYHDGDAVSPSYSPDGRRLFYASTTDAMKENPIFLQHSLRPESVPLEAQSARWPLRMLWSELPFDLYSMSLVNTHIERLTHLPRYESEVRLDSNSPRMVYVAHDKGPFYIVSQNREGGDVQVVLRESKTSVIEPALSRDNLLAWIRVGEDNQSSELWWGEPQGQKRKLSLPGNVWLLSPTWTPDGQTLVFSANYPDPLNFELYSVQRDATCLRRLTYRFGPDLFPDLQKSGQRLIWTVREKDQFQVAMMDYPLSVACFDPSSSLK